MAMGGGGRGWKKQIKAETGVDELAAASAKTALMTVVATALEQHREAILHHAAAYAEATGTSEAAHVVEAAVRKLTHEGVEFFLGKLFGSDEAGRKEEEQ